MSFGAGAAKRHSRASQRSLREATWRGFPREDESEAVGAALPSIQRAALPCGTMGFGITQGPPGLSP